MQTRQLNCLFLFLCLLSLKWPYCITTKICGRFMNVVIICIKSNKVMFALLFWNIMKMWAIMNISVIKIKINFTYMRWTCNGAMFLFTTMMQYPQLNLFALQLTFQSFTESVLFPLYLVTDWVITTAVGTTYTIRYQMKDIPPHTLKEIFSNSVLCGTVSNMDNHRDLHHSSRG
jgi:hypothetical protein